MKFQIVVFFFQITINKNVFKNGSRNQNDNYTPILAKICGALRDLVPFVKPATLLKIDTPPWVFFTFLNCTNGAKSRNAPHICKIDLYITF